MDMDLFWADVFAAGPLGEVGADPVASATRVVAPKWVAPDRGSSLAALTCDAASMASGPDAASKSETAPAEDECRDVRRNQPSGHKAYDQQSYNKAAGAPHEDLTA